MAGASCPLCGEAGLGDAQDLAEHLCRFHAGRWGQKGQLWVSRRQRYARCWCGKSFSTAAEHSDLYGAISHFSEFARHLKQEGGAAAHILAHVLRGGDV